jgi:hypothetical protein
MVYPTHGNKPVPCQYRTSDWQSCKEWAAYTVIPDLYGAGRLHLCQNHSELLARVLLSYLKRQAEVLP